MTSPEPGSLPVRTCGYRKCDNTLPSQQGRGRPLEFCKDRRWPPGGKTCRERETEERKAEQAAGLDVPLAAYREVSEPLLEVLAVRLTQHAGAVRGVESGALARISDAEETTRRAVARAEEAEGERAKTIRQSERDRDEVKQAREDVTAAKRMARDAAADRERQVGAAWRETVEHEGKRAAAEAKAEATA